MNLQFTYILRNTRYYMCLINGPYHPYRMRPQEEKSALLPAKPLDLLASVHEKILRRAFSDGFARNGVHVPTGIQVNASTVFRVFTR